ncbi:MAG TPA: nuclease-related domain-containing protein [Acidimicrobiales bacterium]|nr:nuclease-related domain-containing protein [Acidimicrobiales bacterium]
MPTADDFETDTLGAPSVTVKIMRLRYAGICSKCGLALPKGGKAEWTKATRSITCLACLGAGQLRADEEVEDVPYAPVGPSATAPPHPHPGDAGASARREYERRHQQREERIDARWGWLAPVVKFLGDDPQSTTAWAKGSDGERRLAAHLQRVLGERAVLLHDRKVPKTRGNIDHLAIAASGVWVIDAKNYEGKVERRDVGGWFSTDFRLYVGGRNRTRLVEGLDWQIRAVESAVRDAGVSVNAALCFTDATWKLFAEPFQIGEIWVTWANCLAELIAAPGPLERSDVVRIATELSEALPPAVPSAPL